MKVPPKGAHRWDVENWKGKEKEHKLNPMGTIPRAQLSWDGLFLQPGAPSDWVQPQVGERGNFLGKDRDGMCLIVLGRGRACRAPWGEVGQWRGSAASPGCASGRKEGGRAWWDPARDPSLAVRDVGAGLVPGAAQPGVWVRCTQCSGGLQDQSHSWGPHAASAGSQGVESPSSAALCPRGHVQESHSVGRLMSWSCWAVCPRHCHTLGVPSFPPG